MKKTNVLIIGAGIAGVTLAIYLKRANIDFVLLEGNEVGGKLNSLEKIENYPGLPPMSGKEFADRLKAQLDQFGIDVSHGLVQAILKSEFGYETKVDTEIYESKVVVIASGITISEGNIKGEKEFFGSGVSYCATCDGNFFRGLDVVVYGNNDTALEEALYLTNLVNKLYFVSKDAELVGEEKLIRQLKDSKNVELILSHEIKEIKGDFMGISKVILDDDRELEVKGVFPYVGVKSSKDYLNQLGVAFDGSFIKVDEGFMSISNPGLFAIGDIVPKKVRQLVTAANDGAVASHYIISYLKENK